MVVIDSTGRAWNVYPKINVQGNAQEPDKSTIEIELKLNAYTGRSPIDLVALNAKCVAFVRTL